MRLAQQSHLTLKQLTPQKTAMDLCPFFVLTMLMPVYFNLMYFI
jgi:hypothetical protein